MAWSGPRLIRNGVSLAGLIIVTVTALLFLIVFFADLFGMHANPYGGIIFFLIIPGLFILGLLMVPLGMWRERRRISHGLPPRGWPRLDLNDRHQRRVVFVVTVLTLVNIVIVSLAAYRGIEFMDSTQFCGQVCHTVMEPEFVAFQDGPHSRVRCVSCHIGPGASFFVKSKLDGTRQVVAVAMNSYSRPIASPVHTLRPAREVCEQCHWPEKFHGDRIKKIPEYKDDEQSSDNGTTMRIHVGGGSEKLGLATGIHWHMNVANEVEYISTDAKRQVIPYVRVKDRTGAVREYFAEGITPEQLAQGERRRMDCMDCHNRPSHRFSATPERAVDDALATGEMPRELPFIRRQVVEALKAEYRDKATAEQEIASKLMNFYRSAPGDVFRTKQEQVERAVRAAQRLYDRNNFPAMNVTWGTYADNLGHNDFPGCFRCHDDEHKTKDGRAITQDCEQCHDDISEAAAAVKAEIAKQ
jgi:NapC/NirT cytochrome c family protein